MNEPNKIKALSGEELELKMKVEYISFSAHCDFKQTSEFIEILKPEYIVLVHGDSNEMGRLKASLVQNYKTSKVFSPRNCETVEITFSRPAKIAKVVGSLVKPFTNNQPLSGILIEKDYNYTILSGEDVSSYTSLTSSFIQQSQRGFSFFSPSSHFLLHSLFCSLSYYFNPTPPPVGSSPFLLTGTPAFTTMCSFLVSNFSFPLHSLGEGASIHLYFISFFELGLVGEKSSLCSSLPFVPSSPFVVG